MAKRGSNIYNRKDGRFEGRVHVGYKADGSKKYRSVYGKTLAEVKEKMADLYAVRTEKTYPQYDLQYVKLRTSG